MLLAIGERLPNTLYLMGTVFVVVILIAIPVGVITALKQYSWLDHVVTGVIFTFLSTPTFWLGLLLIILFGLQLHWLPLGGIQTLGQPFDVGDRLRHLILPVATIALVQMGGHVRYLRASMLETIGQDYMRTARAKGLGERVVVTRHALKNAAIPLVTVIGLDMGALLGGADITFECVGRADSLNDAVRFTREGGRVVVVGMPGEEKVDWAPVWQRELTVTGAYAYGSEPQRKGRATFELALEAAPDMHLEALTGPLFGLGEYRDAIAYAMSAGRLGAVKVAFDLRRLRG